jgi:DNA-binding transcriptional regulator LsrR (DeoR family)
MPRFEATGVCFVSLLGGLTRNYAANPHDVMYNLAEKTGSQSYVMPVPFFANSAEDREILLAQRGVREIFDMSNGAGLKFVGIGTADASAQLVASGMIERREITEIAAVGAVGEMLGHFFDGDGRVLETTLSARTLSVDLETPEQTRIVAIAGGLQKLASIRAVLRSRRLKGLITDEPTARALVS